MVVSLRKWLLRLKFLFLFALFTCVLYQVFSALTAWLEPGHKYREPSGVAVKAFRYDGWEMESAGAGERLKLFYWYGE